MNSKILARLSRSCFRTLLVFLVWACVDQRRVVADCRSHDLPAIPLSTGSADVFNLLDPTGHKATTDLAEIPGRSKPCTGPSCSGRPSMPLSPATPDVQRIASWAILPAPVPLMTLESFAFRLDDSGVCPSDTIAPIFHPPRCLPPHIIS